MTGVCQESRWQIKAIPVQSPVDMRKDAPLAFRIPADLKKKLQRLAKQEARSLSQICELLLRHGVEEYDREGRGYLQKTLATTAGASDRKAR